MLLIGIARKVVEDSDDSASVFPIANDSIRPLQAAPCPFGWSSNRLLLGRNVCPSNSNRKHAACRASSGDVRLSRRKTRAIVGKSADVFMLVADVDVDRLHLSAIDLYALSLSPSISAVIELRYFDVRLFFRIPKNDSRTRSMSDDRLSCRRFLEQRSQLTKLSSPNTSSITARTRWTFSSPICTKMEPESVSRSRATVRRSRR